MKLMIAIILAVLMVFAQIKFGFAIFDAPIQLPIIWAAWSVQSFAIIILATWALVCSLPTRKQFETN